MSTTKFRAVCATGGALALAITLSTSLLAQAPPPPPAPPPPGAGPGLPPRDGGFRGPGMGPDIRPGMMMQHTMMRGMAMCEEWAARAAQRRLDRIERAIAPTDAQRAGFDAYRSATTRALDMIRAACPKDPPLTPTGRLEAQEKMLDARLQAVRLLRGALDPLYGSLSDEQKARFNLASAPRPHFRFGWLHRDRMGGGDERRVPRRWSDDDRNQRWGRTFGDRDGFGDGYRDRWHHPDGKGWRDERGRGDRWRERTGDGAHEQQRAPERLGHIEGEEKL